MHVGGRVVVGRRRRRRGVNVITVKTDAAQKLLVITYSGHVDAGDIRRRLEDVLAAVRSMPPGFRLLTDLTDLESMESACAPYIDQVMDLCSEKGVTKVVRVVPDSKKDIGFGVMSRFHYNREVAIITCESVDEATRALAD